MKFSVKHYGSMEKFIVVIEEMAADPDRISQIAVGRGSPLFPVDCLEEAQAWVELSASRKRSQRGASHNFSGHYKNFRRSYLDILGKHGTLPQTF